MTFPFPDNSLMYPDWWAEAETVTLRDINGATATFAPGDARFFPYGVSYPDSGNSINVILPWSYIHSISASI